MKHSLAVVAAGFLLTGCEALFPPQLAELESTPFAIVPAAATLAPFEEITLSLAGGSPPFTLTVDTAVSTGGGELVGETRFRAGASAAGRDLVRAVDADGRTAEAVFSIGPALALTPPEATVAPLGQVRFVIAGGLPPYVATLAAEDGSATGSEILQEGSDLQITAGALGKRVDIVHVVDATGAVSVEARLTRLDELSVAPRFPQVAPGQLLLLSVAGGQPPYALGSIGLSSGDTAAVELQSASVIAYQAGELGEVTDNLEITDANGASLTLEIEVLAALTAEFLRSPIPHTETDSPLVTGGRAPYIFALERDFSGAVVDPNTGLYRPGLRSYLPDRVRVTDALGQFVDIEAAHYVSSPVADTPWDIASGDVNNDGFPDLALSLVTRGEVEILRNDGGVGFLSEVSLVAGDKPRGLVIADIDVDGAVDLVNVDEVGNALYIHWGTSAGSFAFSAPMVLAAGSEPRSVTVSDLDGDPKLEVLVPSYGSDELLIFRQTAPRSFISEAIAVMSTPRFAKVLPSKAVLLVSDTHVVDPSNCINAPDGATPGAVQLLEPPTTAYVAQPPVKAYSVGWDVDAGDFDNDGELDVLFPSQLPRAGCVIRRVRIEPTCHCWSIGEEALRIRVLDVEGDGVLDALTLDPAVSHLTITANFVNDATPSTRSIDVGRAPWSFTLADFNADGRLDIATANAYSSDIGLVLAVGRRAFGDGRRLAPAPTALGAAVVTGSAVTSIYVPALMDQSVKVFTRYADGSTTSGDLLSGRSYINVIGESLAGDRRLIAATAFSNDDEPVSIEVGVLAADGSFDVVTFERPAAYMATFLARASEPHPAIAITVSTGDVGRVTLLRLTSLDPVAVEVAQTVEACDGPARPVAVDLDDDGNDDLVVPCSGDDTIRFWLAADLDAGLPPATLSTPRFPYAGSAGDFDGDGAAEVAITCVSDDQVAIFAGDGTGGLVEQPPLNVALGPDGAAVADFDADGNLDLAVAARISNEVVFLWGDGSGLFPSERRYLAGRAPRWPVAADVDQDGYVDLVVANQASDDVSIFYAPTPEEGPL